MKRLSMLLALLPLIGAARQLRYTFSPDPMKEGKYYFYDATGELAGYTVRSGDGLTIIYNTAGRITGYEQQVSDRTLLLDVNRNRIGYKQISADSTLTLVYDTAGRQAGYEKKVPGWDRRELYGGAAAPAGNDTIPANQKSTP